jgi:hypothetical protein
VDASKESCRKARLELEDQATMIAEPQYKFIHDFLDAAEKKLPMQSSIDRDRAAKRRKAGKVVAPDLLDGIPEKK